MNSLYSGRKSRIVNNKSGIQKPHVIIYSMFYIDQSLVQDNILNKYCTKVSNIYRIPKKDILELIFKLNDLYKGELPDFNREVHMCCTLSRISRMSLGEAAIYIFTHKNHRRL